MKRIYPLIAIGFALLLTHCAGFAWPFANPYKHIDHELLHYVGKGRVGPAYDVQVRDGYAFVTNNKGVVILDVSPAGPGNPVRIGEIDVGSASFGLDIVDSLIYIGCGSGLNITDISRPDAPQTIGLVELNGVVSQVRVRERYAYVASRGEGLIIIDVADPTSPRLVGAYHDGGAGSAVEIVGDIAFFADARDDLKIIDVSDPSAPWLIATVPEARGAWDIAVTASEGLTELFIGCHGDGTLIIHLDEQLQYEVLGRYQDGGEAQGVWIENRTLFVADNFEFEILDVTNPRVPREMINIGGLNGLHDLCVEGNRVYLADGRGLFILQYEGG
jgi:hypothetical protein